MVPPHAEAVLRAFRNGVPGGIVTTVRLSYCLAGACTGRSRRQPHSGEIVSKPASRDRPEVEERTRMARRPNLLVIRGEDPARTDSSPFDRSDGLPHAR